MKKAIAPLIAGAFFLIPLLIMSGSYLWDYIDKNYISNKIKEQKEYIDSFYNNNTDYLRKYESLFIRYDLRKLGYISDEDLKKQKVTLDFLGDTYHLILNSKVDESLVIPSEKIIIKPTKYDVFYFAKISFLESDDGELLLKKVSELFGLDLQKMKEDLKEMEEKGAEYCVLPDVVFYSFIFRNVNISIKYGDYKLCIPLYDNFSVVEDYKNEENLFDYILILNKKYAKGELNILDKVYKNLEFSSSIISILNNINSIEGFKRGFITAENYDLSKYLETIEKYSKEKIKLIVGKENEKEDYNKLIKETRKLYFKIGELLNKIDNKNIEDIPDSQKEELKELLIKFRQDLTKMTILKSKIDRVIEQVKREPLYVDVENQILNYPYYNNYLIDYTFKDESPIDLVIQDLYSIILYVKGETDKKVYEEKVERACKIFNYRVDLIKNPIGYDIDVIKEKYKELLSLLKPTITLSEYEKNKEVFSKIGEGVPLSSLVDNTELKQVITSCKNKKYSLKLLNQIAYLNDLMAQNINTKLYNNFMINNSLKNFEKVKAKLNKLFNIYEKVCDANKNDKRCDQEFIELYKQSIFYRDTKGMITWDSLQMSVTKDEILGKLQLAFLLAPIIEKKIKDTLDSFANEKLIEKEKDFFDYGKVIIDTKENNIYTFNAKYTFDFISLVKENVTNWKYLTREACTDIELPLSAFKVSKIETDLKIKGKALNEKKYRVCFESLQPNQKGKITFYWFKYPIIHVKKVNHNYSTSIKIEEGKTEVVSKDQMEIILEKLEDKVNPYLVINLPKDFVTNKIETKFQERVVIKSLVQSKVTLKRKSNITLVDNTTKKYLKVDEFTIEPNVKQEIDLLIKEPMIGKVKVLRDNKEITYTTQKDNIVIKENFFVEPPTQIRYKIIQEFHNISKIKEYFSKKLDSYKKFIETIPKEIEIPELANYLNEKRNVIETEMSLIKKIIGKKKLNEEDINNLINLQKDIENTIYKINNLLDNYNLIINRYNEAKRLCEAFSKELPKIFDILNVTIDLRNIILDLKEGQEIFCGSIKNPISLSKYDINKKKRELFLKLDKERLMIVNKMSKLIDILNNLLENECIMNNSVGKDLKKLYSLVMTLTSITDPFSFIERINELYQYKDIGEKIGLVKETCKTSQKFKVKEKLQEIEKSLKKLKEDLDKLVPSQEAIKFCREHFDEEVCKMREESLNRIVQKEIVKLKEIEDKTNRLKLLAEKGRVKKEDIEDLQNRIKSVSKEINSYIKRISKVHPKNPYVSKFKKPADKYLINIEEKSNLPIFVGAGLSIIALGGVIIYYLYKKGKLDSIIEKYLPQLKKKKEDDNDNFSDDDFA